MFRRLGINRANKSRCKVGRVTPCAPQPTDGFCKRRARSDAPYHLCLIAFFLVLYASALRAETPVTSFDAANKLYEQGKYADAAAAYQKLIQSGSTSAAVYYNLGNSFFKHGELGRAIAAFRHAQQ